MKNNFEKIEKIILNYGEIVRSGKPTFGPHANKAVLEILELLPPPIKPRRSGLSMERKEYNHLYYETVTKPKRKKTKR